MTTKSKVVHYQDSIGSPSRSDKTIHRVLSQSTRVHILRDKLSDDEVNRLELLAYTLGAQVTTVPDAANVIVTVLKAPKRIAKHLEAVDVKGETQDADEPEGANLLSAEASTNWSKFVVTPEWLVAVQAAGTLVDLDEYLASPSPATQGVKRKRSSSSSKNDVTSSSEPITSVPPSKPVIEARYGSGPTEDTSGKPRLVPRYQNSRFACKRPSPLKCVNQPLVDELEVIRNERRLTGDTYSEMAYMRALSALKAFPYYIPSSQEDAGLLHIRLSEVEKLKGVGKKVFSLIKQFYLQNPGLIIEAKVIRRDRAVFIMNAFTELYGIGPIGAREAYNQGHRTFADVLKRGKALSTHLTAKETLRILPDLRKPISRAECEQVTRLIMDLVRQLLPPEIEVKHQICGGYRRGKPYTYDLDVIIGHSEKPSRALHSRLLSEMQKKGLVTHIVSISTPASADADPDPTLMQNGEIHVDIANIVVLPPITKSNPNPIHRRVDLVFAPLRVYGAVVLGWSGSMIFERDLRLWAKGKGYNFHMDGLTNLAEERVVDTPTEEAIFDILELEYMPPEYRNCDA